MFDSQKVHTIQLRIFVNADNFGQLKRPLHMTPARVICA